MVAAHAGLEVFFIESEDQLSGPSWGSPSSFFAFERSSPPPPPNTPHPQSPPRVLFLSPTNSLNFLPQAAKPCYSVSRHASVTPVRIAALLLGAFTFFSSFEAISHKSERSQHMARVGLAQ